MAETVALSPQAIPRGTSAALAQGERDLRLDFFRGLALFFIFIDHIPDNFLTYFTLRSVAFSDAAEVFIFISGFAAAMAYGKALQKRGSFIAGAQVYRRVWQLYVAHIFLFVIFTAEVSYTVLAAQNPMYGDELGIAEFLDEPHVTIIRTLMLQFQPAFLDILPLYIVLLAAFPFVLMALARHSLLALIPSALLYGATLKWGWALPGYPQGHVWFFNPLAWQFLFVCGAACGYARVSGRRILPNVRWIPLATTVFVVAAAIINLTWIAHWLYDPIGGLFLKTLWPHTIDKTNLAPLRLVNFLAIALTVVHFVRAGNRFLRSAIARPIILCGQNSLYVFCLGILLSVLGHFILSEVDGRIPMQLLINVCGAGLMITAAQVIAWYKSLERAAAPRGA